MNRDKALTTAGELINGDRARDYGDASVNFGRIADLWTAQFQHKLNGAFTASDVAIALTHLKLSRLAVTPAHADSWVDAAGYVALGAELATGDTGTPEPSAGPSEGAPRGAQPRLHVGARVRVADTCDFRTGEEGKIVGKASSDKFDWDVDIDGYMLLGEFHAHELEVIK